MWIEITSLISGCLVKTTCANGGLVIWHQSLLSTRPGKTTKFALHSLCQAFFWTIFRQFNSTGVAGFWVFLEFWLEFFQDFAWVLSFFMSFLEYLKKVQIFSNFWKYLMIKRLILGVPLSFPPKNWVFFQFSNSSSQLELPVFEFFRNLAWVFSRFSLSFEFFWAWVFFWNVQKKAWL